MLFAKIAHFSLWKLFSNHNIIFTYFYCCGCCCCWYCLFIFRLRARAYNGSTQQTTTTCLSNKFTFISLFLLFVIYIFDILCFLFWFLYVVFYETKTSRMDDVMNQNNTNNEKTNTDIFKQSQFTLFLKINLKSVFLCLWKK